ncbi:methane monooxygenase/ammonia monooxygenase subunit C, partial [Nitrosospira briensis]
MLVLFSTIRGGNNMATTLETSSHAKSKSGGRDYDMSEWYDSRWYKFGLITMLAVAIFWIW